MNNRRESLPSAAWGKRSAEDDWLPLSDHMADVAACFSALIRIPLFRERLACALCRTSDLVTEARLAALAYLHDLGKLSSTFQARMLDPAIRAGHTTEGWHLLRADAAIHIARALALPEIVEWGDAALRLSIAPRLSFRRGYSDSAAAYNLSAHRPMPRPDRASTL